MKLRCISFEESNLTGEGARLGPDQKGYPSLSFASLGKMLSKSYIV